VFDRDQARRFEVGLAAADGEHAINVGASQAAPHHLAADHAGGAEDDDVHAASRVEQR